MAWKNVLTLHSFWSYLKPGLHMIVTVGDASPRQAREHIGDSCVKWKHFLRDVADQTGTVRGHIERVEMSLKPGFRYPGYQSQKIIKRKK